MDIYESLPIAERVRGNAYPGRGIVLGLTEDGTRAVAAYFIMGRSANSRNRIFAVRNGEVFTDAKGIEICRLVEQRLEYDSTIKQLENDKKELDNKLAAIMKDKEKFVVPGCSVTYKLVEGRETASVRAIKAYYEARHEKIPDGFISKGEDSRGIRFYPSRKKAK